MTSLDYPATPLAAVLFYFYTKRNKYNVFLSQLLLAGTDSFTSIDDCLSNDKNDPLMLLEANFIAGREYWYLVTLYLDDFYLSFFMWIIYSRVKYITTITNIRFIKHILTYDSKMNSGWAKKKAGFVCYGEFELIYYTLYKESCSY